MTTHRHHNTERPDSDDHRDRPPIDPLRSEQLLCPCGATADDDGLCRKCRARARWDRRTIGRRTHADRSPTHPGSCRPRSRRPGR